MQDVNGIVTLKKIQEMKRIESEYVSQRDTNFEVQIRPDVVVLPQDALERTNEVQVQRPIFLGNARASAGFRLTPNGFRLRM
jgi:Holliday junction resolvase-like predicted endonuclease